MPKAEYHFLKSPLISEDSMKLRKWDYPPLSYGFLGCSLGWHIHCTTFSCQLTLHPEELSLESKAHMLRGEIMLLLISAEYSDLFLLPGCATRTSSGDVEEQ